MNIDPHQYSNLLNRLELQSIFLAGNSFVLHPDVMLIKNQREDEDFDLKFSLVDVDFSFLGDQGILMGFFDWNTSIERDDRRIYDLNARYISQYFVDGQIDEEIIPVFMRRTGKLSTFPYFRALTHRLNAEAGLDLPPLPILKSYL